jgi:hypothetical protein
MTKSGHFTAEEWVDFARNTASLRQDAMQHHLDEGCHDCTQQHQTWRAVVNITRSEAQYEPPPDTLRVARALYHAPKAESRLTRTIEAARLLFDSRLVAAPIGVRSGSSVPCKLLYAHGAFLIDLQVERSAEHGMTALLGQVTVSPDRNRSAEGVQILVLNHTTTIATATTNKLGEFHVEFEPPTGDLSLALGFEDEETLITLGRLTKGQS